MPTILSDKKFWQNSQFWLGMSTLITLISLQFPEWDRWTKVAIQVIQILATMFVIDQTTRSVSMKDIAEKIQAGQIQNVVLTERDGITPMRGSSASK